MSGENVKMDFDGNSLIGTRSTGHPKGQWLLLGGLLATAFLRGVTPYMMAATANYGFLSVGLLWRRHKSTHALLMSLGVIGDIVLVLVLEITRNAVKTASEFSLTPLQQAHVICSLLAVVLYIPVVILGVKRFNERANEKQKRSHFKLGVSAFVLRTLGFIFMFSMIGRTP